MYFRSDDAAMIAAHILGNLNDFLERRRGSEACDLSPDDDTVIFELANSLLDR